MTAAMARTRVPRCPRPDPTPETTALNPPFPRLALAALICVPVAAHAELIDYAQVDTSSSATTAVLVGAVGSGDAATPAPIVSATFTRWDTGEAASLGYTVGTLRAPPSGAHRVFPYLCRVGQKSRTWRV